MIDPANPFAPFLNHQGFVLLDGGLGTALEAAGCDLHDDLWSARVLLDGRDTLGAVHTAFLDAGADVLGTCTYQASEPGFMAKGMTAEEARTLIRGAVELAVDARDAFEHDDTRLRPLVAASVGPYGAFLADGSEYSGAYTLSSADLEEFHRARWFLLAEPGPDLMACETMPSIREIEVLLGLLDETEDLWAWVSFSCRDSEHLADGTPISDACALVAAHARVAAVGANCFTPELAPALLRTFRDATDLPIILYPNSGETYDAQAKTWHRTRSGVDLAQAAPDWVSEGASCVGGCCRTDPRLISRIRAGLRSLA